MKSSRMIQRLIWKSVRQASSLVVVLFTIVTVLVIALAAFQKPTSVHQLGHFFGLVPILFSVGAGGTLVSLDRDSKAIDWLKSLPVRWQTIVFTPMVVSAVILIALWSIVQCYLSLVQGHFISTDEEFHAIRSTYVLANSFYLLLCGFAGAWMFRSPLPALLSIFLFASIPTLFEVTRQVFIRWLSGDFYVRYVPDLDLVQALGLLGICGLGMMGLVSFSAHRVLAPAVYRSASNGRLGRIVTDSIAPIADSLQSDTRRETRPMVRKSTLLWGFYRENRSIFRAAQASCLLLAFALLTQVYSPASSSWQTVATVIIVLAGLLLAIIPTLTFQADSMGDRIRFLTDRGVRPAELWWSRQLVTFGITSLLACTLLVIGRLGWQPSETFNWPILFTLLFNAYALSQWIGQIIPRVVTACFTSLVAIGLTSTFIVQLHDERWIVLIGDIVLLFATYWMTQPWMERRTHWRYWLKHATFTIPVYVLFASIFLSAAVQYTGFERLAIRGRELDWQYTQHRIMVLIFNAYAISQWLGLKIDRPVIAILASVLIGILSSNLVLAMGDYFWLAIMVDLTLIFDANRRLHQPVKPKNSFRTAFDHFSFVIPVYCLLSIGLGMPGLFQILTDDGFAVRKAEVVASQPATKATVHLQLNWSNETESELVSAPNTATEDRQQDADNYLKYLTKRSEFERHRLFDVLSEQVKPGTPLSTNHLTWVLIGHGERLHLEAKQQDFNQSSVDAYSRWVGLIARVTSGLRLSRDFWTQEDADHLEIWLIKQCLNEETRSMIDDQSIEAICRLVGNKHERWNARRRAAMFFLTQLDENRSADQHWQLASMLDLPDGVSPQHFCQTVLQDIDAALSDSDQLPMSSVCKINDQSSISSYQSEYRDWIMVNDARLYTFGINYNWPFYMLWGAGWETQGEHLRESINSNDAGIQEITK